MAYQYVVQWCPKLARHLAMHMMLGASMATSPITGDALYQLSLLAIIYFLKLISNIHAY